MYFKDFLYAHPSFTAAFPARVLYDLSCSMAGRAGLPDAEKTLGHGDMACAAAFRTSAFPRTLLASTAVAGIAGFEPGDFNFPVGPVNGFFKIYFYVETQVGAVPFAG